MELVEPGDPGTEDDSVDLRRRGRFRRVLRS
jgi:hypothetical protein